MKKSDNIYAWIVGISIMLFAVHHPQQPFLEYAFIPTIAMFSLCMAVFMWTAENYRRLSLGDKKVWIPMAVIAFSISTSGFVQLLMGGSELPHALASLAFGIILFEHLQGRTVRRNIKPYKLRHSDRLSNIWHGG